jgi:hypothetical protein
LYEASNISDAINGGAGFVIFNGHGNLDLWATHPHEQETVWIPRGLYRNSHVIALSNGNMLPIIISDACHHCKYDVKSDCFGWTFVTNPTGGCIAFLGSTDIDTSYGGVDIVTKGIEKMCLEMAQHYVEGATTFGELWSKIVTTYLPANLDEIDYITVEEFQPFGDPSLRIALGSNPPEKPDVPNGPASGQINTEYTYTASTTDPDGDQIYYLFDWGDGTYSKWVGPYDSGVDGTATHTWTQQGNYEIRVKAKDIHEVQSKWSDPRPVTMPKDSTFFPCLFPDLNPSYIQSHDISTLPDWLLQWIIEIFGIYINGTGQTAADLDEFQGWRINLEFEFIDQDASLCIGWLGFPFWEMFPNLFTIRGPNAYRVFLFYGTVKHTSPGIYNIKGHCLRIAKNPFS